jgi:acyl-CoA synthetase (NDP forming)
MRMLLEPRAAALLTDVGIAYVEHGVVATADEAVAVAAALGYPVVLKVVSADVVHKTEVGGVLVGLSGDAAVAEGFERLLASVARGAPMARVEGVLVGRHVMGGRELIVGALRDATFGPTVMLGLGGVFAEALGDVAFRLAPLHVEDALEMLGELKGAQLLTGYRGHPPVDLEAVATLCVRVGDLMCSHQEIGEIDLNPVAAKADGCVVLDARIIMSSTPSREESAP